MATSGGSRREPEEGIYVFNEEIECPSTPKTLTSKELSLPLPLVGASGAGFRRGLSDEGLPLSPEVCCTPREDLIADIKRLEQRMEEVTGVLASLSNLSEGTQTEQQSLNERFQELKQEQNDSKLRYIMLSRMVERLEDRLKIEEENQKKFDDKITKGIEKGVKEEMDRRKSEYMAEIEGKMKEMLMEAQSKNEEREIQLHVRKQRLTETMTDQRVTEVKQALVEALKERDEVKKKFKVTLVRLRGEEGRNAQLLQRIEELERRCEHLEEENARLRLSDIVRQTNFTFEGPKLECFSCRQEYSTSQNDAGACKYHPIPCMPHETWRNCIPLKELPSGFTMSQRYHYWACCNILATRRPEGCCHGRHHQQWEMDIMMRQVLVEGGEHSAFTDPLKVQ